MYGFIEISDVDVILKTWSKTEIPPKPSKNEQIIIFTEIALNGIFATIETPFVSSTIPAKIPLANDAGRFNLFNKGDTIRDSTSNILVLLRIEITTLNSMTNPPIIITVFMELIILFCKIAPRFPKLGAIFVSLFEYLRSDMLSDFFLHFQNLNKIPTVKLAKICVKNNTSPIVVLPKRAIPTVPIIKSGPELFVKVISLSASSFVQMPFFLKFVTIFAPTGYPTYNSHN